MNTDCREIVDEQPKAHTELNETPIDAVVEEHAEPEEVVDPEDPLYGLEQRLQGLNVDDESKRIIKDKLAEASNKIK